MPANQQGRPSRWRRTLAAAVVLAAGILVLVPTTAAPASEAAPQNAVGIRLLDAPDERRDDPRAGMYVVDHLAPGARIDRRVEVVNDSDVAVTMLLYAGAAEVAAGAFTFGDHPARNELTTWTGVTPGELQLAPRARGVATVTVHVPLDAAPGERYAVVWAQQAPRPGTGILEVGRAGVRMYLSVGEGAEPASDFTIESLTASRQADGSPVVRAMVHNTGARALDLSGELRLTDGPGGLSAGPFPVHLGTTTAPGASDPVVIALDPAVPDGPWQVQLTLRAGALERTSGAQLTFPARAGFDGPAVAAMRSPDGRSPLHPVWWGVATGLLFATAIGAGVVLARRRRRHAPS